MDSDYNFTMSDQDQSCLINIGRGSSYGQLMKNIKERLEAKNDNRANFKDQSSSKFVLSLIDKKMMKETINSFPIDLALNNRESYTFSKLHTTMGANPDKIYDVRFVMPLIYHSVSPSLFVDCRDFIARRCLALTIVGLSSEDPQMRSLCYKILERYYDHLLSALLIDKQLWINFLDLIRASIPASNTKLKFIFTTFLNRIIDVLLHPNKDKLYELVKEFLAGRPRLRIDTIEIYDDLLLCSDVANYNYNLRWLMTLFRDGLMSYNDLKVAIDLKVIPQAMCLYNSELRFDRANETIISIFIRIAFIENGAKLLVDRYSFLPWLHHIILHHLQQDCPDTKKSESLSDITKSLSSLVFGLIDNLMITSSNQNPSLITIFLALHSLIIKSKNCEVLRCYLDYVRIVTMAITESIPGPLAGHLLELVHAKI